MSHTISRAAVLLLLGAPIAAGAQAATAPIMIVGIDTKFWFDDKGARVFKPDTGDVVQFYELSDPAHPALIGTLPMTNSVVGPPTNLAVSPDGRLALIANSLTTVPADNGAWKSVPDEVVK